VRLLGAIAAVLVTLIVLSIPQPVQKLPPSRVVRGEFGAHILSFAVSPTSAQIATTNQVGRLTLRTPDQEKHTDRLLNFPGYATEVTFSPDGRTLAALGSAPSICLWDLRFPRNQPTATVTVPIQQPKRIMYSPDGQSIAVTSYLDVFEGHTRPVNSVAFSPDGSLLATAGNDGMLGLWTVATGRRQASLDGQAMNLRTVAFSSDGRTLALATGDDDDVRLWDVAEILRARSGSNSAR
jgi:WD40 repeat protein